ncbi:MAG: sulfotransferase domain-containing protein [Pseudomonadales bacterium]|jgi:aryl sulfotransferase
MPESRPSVTRVYQNHHLDSTRWEGYRPRDGDVIVTTSYKAGTTFTQSILMSMICGRVDDLDRQELSPWVDARMVPETPAQIFAALDTQTHQRFIKSHLALDGLPYFDNVHYLIVARDPRDVFMSLANHYRNYTDFAYGLFNDGRQNGDPLPRFESDLEKLWRNWITRGWFEWETEGYPFWGNMHHIQTYWAFRQLPNLHFLNYADMIADLPGTIRRIAAWIDFPVTDADVERVAAEVNFESMKKKAIEEDAKASPDGPRFFAGGNAAFINKGTNGRWRNVLTEDDLALYEDAKARVLDPACAAWLENGGTA